MSLEININMCRICMKTNDGISIYSDTGIIKKFQFCTQLQISKTDDLPKIICNNCVGRLEIAYDFCKQAECSDKYLRQVITHQKEENQSALGKQGLYDEMVLEIYRTRIKVEQDDQIEQLTDFELEEVSNVNISPTLEGININCKGTERLTDSVPVYAVVGECGAADKVKIEEIEEADIEKIQETKQINLFTIAKVTSIPKTEFNETNEITGNESCSQEYIESLSGETQIKVEQGDQMKQPTNVKSVKISGTIEEGIQYKGSSSGADLAKIEKLQETIFTIAKVTSIRKNEDKQTDKFECIECGAHFTRKGSLKRHSLIHSGERPSGTSFANESLERHSQIQLGERSYKKGGDQTDKFECIECGSKFTRKGSLKRHSLIHSGERPSGTSPQNKSLKRHSQILLDERSYKSKGDDQTDKCVCMVCGERFTTNGSLKRHSITHSGVRPYKCNLCSRSFALSFNLESHKRLHTGEIGYTCETCGSHFRSKKTLMQHVFIKHRNEKKTEMEINVINQTEQKKQPTQNGTTLAEIIEEGVNFKGTEQQVYTCESKEEEIEEEIIQETKPINDITITEVTSIRKNDDDEQTEQKKQPEQNGTALAETIEGVHLQRQVYTCESEEKEKKEEIDEEKIQETKPINDITITEVISIRKNDEDQTDKIECDLCGARFTKRASLKRHSILHSGARPHKCNFCSRSFAQAYNLATHKRRHRGEKGYTCETCGSLFRSKKTLKQHVFINHGNQKKVEKEINGVKIQETKPINDITIREVFSVRRSSNPTDKIECTLCGAKFTKRASLNRHSLIHSGERPHKCNSCDQSFAQRYNLICHMMTHSAEKPYICETCGLPFRHQNSLNRHVFMKHGTQKKDEMEINGVKIQETKPTSIRKNDKPIDKIECTLCGAKFTKRASLKRHSLIHSGERPHKCNLCDLSFAQKYTLSCHMVRHADEKPYTCKTCGLPFRLQKTLDRHVFMKHENQKKAEVERIILKQKEQYWRKRQLLLARETPEEAALRREKEAAGTRRQRDRAKQMQRSKKLE